MNQDSPQLYLLLNWKTCEALLLNFAFVMLLWFPLLRGNINKHIKSIYISLKYILILFSLCPDWRLTTEMAYYFVTESSNLDEDRMVCMVYRVLRFFGFSLRSPVPRILFMYQTSTSLTLSFLIYSIHFNIIPLLKNRLKDQMCLIQLVRGLLVFVLVLMMWSLLPNALRSF